MQEALHRGDLQDLKDANRKQRAMIIGLILLSLLLAFKALTKETTTVLEPPTRSQRIAVSGDRVDGAWLEEMGAWIAHMMLDVTPQSTDWQQEQILNWTNPALHGDLEQRMTAQAKRIKDSNASTIFWPQQVAADVDGQRTLILGRLETLVNGSRTGIENVAYMAGFKAKSGRNLLVSWDEVPVDDPWLVKRLAELAAKAEKAEKDKKSSSKK